MILYPLLFNEKIHIFVCETYIKWQYNYFLFKKTAMKVYEKN